MPLSNQSCSKVPNFAPQTILARRFLFPQILANLIDRYEKITVYRCQWLLLILQVALVFFLREIPGKSAAVAVLNCLLIGTADEKVSEVLAILKKHSSTRKKALTSRESFGRGLRNNSIPESVTVRGATYFVLNVEEFGNV